MNKRQIKVFGEAYDKLYDLNSVYGYAFSEWMERLEAEVGIKGYFFRLSKCDKWKCIKIKED